MVNSIAQPGTLLAHDGITCKNTDSAGEKGAQHAQHNTIIKSVIDATVLQHAGLAISNIGSTLAYPKDGAEIAPAVVARLNNKAFHRKGNQGNDGHAGQQESQAVGQGSAQRTQIKQGNIGAFACNSGIGFAIVQHLLINQHNAHADENQNQGHQITIAGVQSLQSTEELCGQHMVAHWRT